MRLFNRLLWRSRRPARAHIMQQAARVIDKAMSDVGIVEFLNGSVMLDDHFRPRFLGASASCKSSGVAIVILSQLDEVPAMRTLSLPIDFAGREHQERSAALLSGVIREFHSQSAAFRSLR